MKALPLGGYVKIAGMNPYEPVAPEDLHRSLRREAHLAARAGDPRRTGRRTSSSRRSCSRAGCSSSATRGRRRRTSRASQTTLNGQRGPAAAAGIAARGRIVRCGRRHRPHAGRAAGVHDGARRRARRVHDRARRPARSRWMITPEPDTIGGETIGRIGVVLGPAKVGPVAALVGGREGGGQRDRRVDPPDHARVRARRGSAGSSRCCSPTRSEARRIRRAWSGSARRSARPGSAGDWGAGPVLPRVRDGVHRAHQPACRCRRSTAGIWRSC